MQGPEDRPARQPAAVWFPYRKMGQSAADLCLDDTGGAFGPFAGQFLVGDQMNATVMRAWLEKVEGHYQGGCAPFLTGFQSGVNRMAFAPDGSLMVGMTDRGWGSVGRKTQGLQRVVFSGVSPFDLSRVFARDDGFLLEFTADLDPTTAADPASYAVVSHTYEYHAAYGAPEDDRRELEVTAVQMVDGRHVRLTVEGLRSGYVHEVDATDVRSLSGGESPLYGMAWYTLINIPGGGPRQWLDDGAHSHARND